MSDPTIGTGSDSSAAAAPVSPIPEKTPIDSLGVTLQQPEKSLLRHWLGECKKPDPDKERTERWESMGWEVFERKALLIAAAKDLKENGINEPLKLAATDIFVEKAQRFLDSRGKRMYLVGGANAGVAILVLAVAAWFVLTRNTLDLLGIKNSSATVSAAFLSVLILKSTTAGAFIVGIATFLVSLSRALLHEATVLYSRRHSLRFGRLFVYLMSEKMTREDLVAVFNWNAEFSTAFKDIQAENVAKSPLIKSMEVPAEVIKSINELAKTLRPEKPEDQTPQTKQSATAAG